MTRPSSRFDADVLRASWRHWLQMTAPAAGPRWLQLVWTALFSAVLALGFTVVGLAIHSHTMADWLDLRRWVVWYGANLVVSSVISFTIHGLFALGRAALGLPRIAALGGWRRLAFFCGLPLLGVALGWPLGVSLVYRDPHILAKMTGADVFSMTLLALITSGLIFSWFTLRHRQLTAEMHAKDAQLRLLQGQMEPHFLFNTLANVISLVDTDAPRAKQVLEAFTEYLRAALGSLREGDSTLAGELELATRFLELMQARMGERLRFEFDVPAELRSARLPPLLLQPLVENAVKHGLEPQVAGGTVRIRARAVPLGGAPGLELCVADDGIGLEAAAARGRRPGRRPTDGNGIALANLRERLQARFGATATLELARGGAGAGPDAAEGRGVRIGLDGNGGGGPAAGTLARLVLPLRPAPDDR